MPKLEDRIVELYGLPLAEFTSARNALAKTLSGADAKQVKQLAKPTVVPWAVNQVYWKSRPIYDRLLKSGHTLREAQIAALRGKPNDVRGSADRHRAAVADAVAEASRLAGEAGANPGAEPLARMFETLSLAPKHPGDPGRLTDVLQPAGFEALLGVTPAGRGTAPPVAEPRDVVQAEPHRDGEDGRAEPARQRKEEQRARAEQARQARQAREAAAFERERAAERRRAEQAVERAEQAEAAARADLERAQDRLSEAARTLAAARKALRDLPA